MPSNIKPGYLLKITTWENDGDNYNTVENDGLTADQVRFYIHVCKKFSGRNAGSFGNQEVSVETFHEGMIEHIADYEGEVPLNWRHDVSENAHMVDEYFYYELLGDIGIDCTEYGFWRVFERAEVFLVPQPIQNVSDQFR